MKNIIILFVFLLSITLNLFSKKLNKAQIIQENNIINLSDTISTNYVPDEITAKKIAEAIWIPIYGENNILQQGPYDAILVNDIWIVKGLIPKPFRDNPEYSGGTAYIEIRKSDCKILKVTHGR